MKHGSDTSNNDQSDIVQISKTQWESNPATTIGRTTKVVKTKERRGWKPLLVRQGTFDHVKDVTKAQSKSKRTLDLAGVADGLLAYLLAHPELIEAGIAEGRKRKHAEIMAAAKDWAD